MKSRRYLGGTVILASLALLSGCAKSPESTVENFYRSLAKGEITEAKGYVSAQLVGMMGDGKLSAALSGETERIRDCGGIKSIEVRLQGEGEIRSGVATVTYGGKCSPKIEKTKLVKEDGKWKITASK
ncbi:MAG: DUF4878 domain-containing protein [Sulfuritalea sp.]|nr:DUF4878 domain-containing protein [Sulfuritalea sp.]